MQTRSATSNLHFLMCPGGLGMGISRTTVISYTLTSERKLSCNDCQGLGSCATHLFVYTLSGITDQNPRRKSSTSRVHLLHTCCALKISACSFQLILAPIPHPKSLFTRSIVSICDAPHERCIRKFSRNFKVPFCMPCGTTLRTVISQNREA